MSRKIENIIDELIDQYQEEDRYNRPWIIGFSGGKDSTVLLTLVWLALLKIRENNPATTFKRQVYVVCNDNPVIEEYFITVLQTIQKTAKEQQLPPSIFITNNIAEDGEAIILIGIRFAESQQRTKLIKKHSNYKLAA